MRELNARGKKWIQNTAMRWRQRRCYGDKQYFSVSKLIVLPSLQVSISLCCVYRFFVVENVMESVALFLRRTSIACRFKF